MEKIALAVFGTSDGTDAYVSPRSFALPHPSHSLIDTAFPFLADCNVFRYYRVPGAERDMALLAIYTKVDDFGGPREGAFAGAGVFVRNVRVDSRLLVNVLQELLSGLIAAATQEGRFVRRVSDAMGQGLVKAPTQAAALAESARPLTAANLNTTVSPTRQLLAIDEALIANAVSFFECVQTNPEWFGSDVFFCRDSAVHQVAREIATISTVTVSALKQRWSADQTSYDDARTNELNAVRNKIKTDAEISDRAIKEARAAATRLASELAALKQDIHATTNRLNGTVSTLERKIQSQLTADVPRADRASARPAESIYRTGATAPIWLDDPPPLNQSKSPMDGSKKTGTQVPQSEPTKNARSSWSAFKIFSVTLVIVLIATGLGLVGYWAKKDGTSTTGREGTAVQSAPASTQSGTTPSSSLPSSASSQTVTEVRASPAASPSQPSGGTMPVPKPALDQRYIYTTTPNSSINSAATLSEELTSQRHCPSLRHRVRDIADAIRDKNKTDVADDETGSFKFRGGAALQIVFFLSADCTLTTKNSAIKKSPI